MVVWLTENFGTASQSDTLSESIRVIDVRDLVEGKGNDKTILKEKVLHAANELKTGRKVIIRCERGIVRSNTLAIGVLVYLGLTYGAAVKQVSMAVGIQSINLDLLNDVMVAVNSI